jgi:16S rRNA (cytosine1402-N4)-methyltransferase
MKAHVPVLRVEVLEALQPHRGGRYIDGTLGAGGHAEAILQASAPDGRLLGLDGDPEALALARETLVPFGERAILVRSNFTQIKSVATAHGFTPADGVLLDLGLSSMQLANLARGFSFQSETLDMRMDDRTEQTAAEIVNTWAEGDLANLIFEYGEERQSHKIARAIVEQRPIASAQTLAQLIERAVGRRGKIHAATRTFQALRIAVNQELENIEATLPELEEVVGQSGRVVIITFHSLEDRIVKRFIADRADVATGSRHLPEAHARTATFRKAGGGVTAGDAEVAANPRARSARLRAAIRTEAPARSSDFSIFGLPKLPGIDRPGER